MNLERIREKASKLSTCESEVRSCPYYCALSPILDNRGDTTEGIKIS